ncbi:MAG: hypothetical protein AAB606_00370 [Patescibacteria group bacterium]
MESLNDVATAKLKRVKSNSDHKDKRSELLRLFNFFNSTVVQLDMGPDFGERVSAFSQLTLSEMLYLNYLDRCASTSSPEEFEEYRQFALSGRQKLQTALDQAQ